MKLRLVQSLLILLVLLAFPSRSPAPLIYRPGEGWTYEPAGGGDGKWRRTRAKEQLEVAQQAFDKKNYSLSLKAARRVVSVWPLSDFAPQAQFLVGRSYEGKGKDEKAFKEYQKLLEKHPKFESYQDVLQRQYLIANKFLAGKWFKLWGVVPFFSSMEKTSEMYDKIVKNGPYGEIAPQAQMSIGTAREKQKNYPLAAKAYQVAADRYHDRPAVAADALYREGLAYQKQAQTAEYDQNTASQAIATFTDFMTLYPNDPRVKQAQSIIASLRGEQARGNYQIARFYEGKRKWRAAETYYNEVVNLTLDNPKSQFASDAKVHLDAIKARRGQPMTQPKQEAKANPEPKANPEEKAKPAPKKQAKEPQFMDLPLK